jgi:hypothetical protein
MSVKTFTSKLLAGVKTNLQAQNIQGQREVATLALGLENLDDAGVMHAKTLTTNLDEAVSAALAALSVEEFGTLSTAQVTAARFAARIAMDPKAAVFAKPRLIDGDTTISAESLGVSDSMSVDNLNFSAEAFDGQPVNNALYYSIVYNAGAARQDMFGETFFKTIVIDPAVSGISVDVEFTAIYTDFERNKDGSPSGDKFNMIPVVKAIYNNEIFGQDKNRIAPVKSAASAAMFMTGEDYQGTSNGETITTAPLLFGKKIGLLGLSQNPAMLAKGTMDSTDALDHTLNLDRVYVSLTADVAGSPVTENFRFTVAQLPQSNFVPKVQGQFKDIALAFESTAVTIHTGTQKTSTGAASQILAGITGDHSVRLKITLHGDANTQYGDIQVFGSNVEVIEVRNAAGDVIPATSAEYLSVVSAFAELKLAGYTVEAYRTNSNIRTRGLLATNWNKKQVYQVPLRSGLTVLTPVSGMGGVDNDAARLTSQIQIAGIRTSIEAVKTLVAHADLFAQAVGNNTVSEEPFVGTGSTFVKTYFNEFDIDLGTSIDSIKSTDRLDDIKHGLVNRIREEVLNAYIKSGYNVAFEQANGNMGGKVKVVLGTDPHIKQYLTNDSGRVSIGDEFEVTVVSTPNPLIEGKVFISFLVTDDENTVNPLNFGNCIWAPTITMDIQRSNGGSVVREFNNIPRYLHIVNLPILSVINVKNVALALNKLAINMRSI